MSPVHEPLFGVPASQALRAISDNLRLRVRERAEFHEQMADPVAAITASLGEPLMVVTAEDRARWHRRIIYAWIRGDEVLYIGASWRGVERPMGVAHEKIRDFQSGDRLVIWAPLEADGGTYLGDIEDRLIRQWRPRHNKPNGGPPCPDCGGRWKIRDRRAGRCSWCQRRQVPPVSVEGQVPNSRCDSDYRDRIEAD